MTSAVSLVSAPNVARSVVAHPLGLQLTITTTLDLLSQELRATSTGSGPAQWLAGVYYDEQQLEFDTWQVQPAMAGMATTTAVDQKAITRSAFAEFSYRVFETVTTRLGARYSDIDKSSAGTAQTWVSTPASIRLVGPTYTFPLNFAYSDSSFDPAVTLEWRPSEGRLVFASWRKGFKACSLIAS